MTVQSLATRLARWSNVKTLSNMQVEDQLIIVDCINTAVYNWFASAPENMRMTTASHLIRAKETGSGGIIRGANTLTGVTLQDYHLGASILIDGDPIMNEVVSVGDGGIVYLLNEVRTDSGVVSYEIFFDTIMITDQSVNRLVSNPRILDTGVELSRDETMKFIGAERNGSTGWWSASATRNYGTPYRYVIENTGVSMKDEARIMVRMDPIPIEELTVVFDVVSDPISHTINDINGNVSIAVPDSYVLPHVLPLALGELASSPIWDNEAVDKNLAIANSNSIVAKIQKDLQPNRGAPKNFIRTRPGY